MKSGLHAVAVVSLTLAAVGALVLALSTAVVAPAGAQTATPANDSGAGDDGAVGTVIEVSFADALSEDERVRAAGILEARLSGSPGYEGTVRTTADGLLVQVRPTAPPAVVDLLLQRGDVTVTARNPDVQGVELFDNAGVARTGELRRGTGAVILPVYLMPEAAGGMSETLVRLNHTTNPGSCDQANRTGHCLLVRLDGSVVNVAGITPRFADVVAAGNFTGDRGFAVATGTLDPAVRLQVALAADPLPATATATRVENVTALEGTDGTPTADPVTTEPGGSPTATPADGSPGGAESPPSDTPVTTGGGTPGFTPVALLLAVLALAALAAQTDRS